MVGLGVGFSVSGLGVGVAIVKRCSCYRLVVQCSDGEIQLGGLDGMFQNMTALSVEGGRHGRGSVEVIANDIGGGSGRVVDCGYAVASKVSSVVENDGGLVEEGAGDYDDARCRGCYTAWW